MEIMAFDADDDFLSVWLPPKMCKKIRSNKWNHVQILKERKQITYYLNGTLACTFKEKDKI